MVSEPYVVALPRVITPPSKSWIFFLENSRTWKVLENNFDPGKSWKLKLKVLESPEKYSCKSCILLVVQVENKQERSFSRCRWRQKPVHIYESWRQIFYLENAVFSLYLNIRGLRTRPGKLFMGVLESRCKVLDFLSVKEWETLLGFRGFDYEGHKQWPWRPQPWWPPWWNLSNDVKWA